MAIDQPAVVPPARCAGRVSRLLTGNRPGRLSFTTETVDTLIVDFEGIVDNRFRGWTRRADSRAPYIKRGTPIRNERQISLLSSEDLAEMAQVLDASELDPAWLGANVVVSGIERFSYLPRGTLLMMAGGAILAVTDQNAPCTLTGEVIGNALGRPDLKLEFPKRAQGLRGLVAAVHHPGTICAGAPLEARLPAQWIYQPTRRQ